MFQYIIGIIASVLTGVCMLPQLIKIIKEKKAEGTSLLMLIVLITGLCAWVYYGALKHDWILIIANAFSALVNITIAILKIKYHSKGKLW